ncbi:uncharacterized protein LOC129600135 isoform X2 [Paramacrobiotus metropolitanus]|uniref:uncharacterized protein LOC129600135 isoform X2 n=1 Tax=Paramacrobiotus metropolitanus TaxID=2943436 RepID=UPI0024458A2F|nr:uncharacterized protein LOC129600135 isoform X2 [Paramacrobiotus metropolitanus]
MEFRFLPETLLLAIGVLPLHTFCNCSSKWKCTARWTVLLPMAFILGGLAHSILITAEFVAEILHTPYSTRENPTLHALSVMWNMIFVFQPTVVLFLFLCKRTSWHRAQRSVENLADLSGTRITRLCRWKSIARFLSLISLFVTVMWEFLDWRSYMDNDPRFYGKDFQQGYTPLPIKISVTNTLLIWIALCTIPYYLVQQLHICVILSAIVLRDACAEMLHRLQVLCTDIQNNRCLPVGISRTVLSFYSFYVELVNCLHDLNTLWNSVLCSIFGFNTILTCCFLAMVMFSPSEVVTVLIFNYASLITFLGIVVVFSIPLVQVHEQGRRIPLLLYQLQMAVENLKKMTPEYKEEFRFLIHVLEYMEDISQDHNLCFSGSDFVVYSRHVLAKACAMLLSAAILAQGIVNRSRINALCD